ncbi:MAG: cysteine hydrolase family protein [Anaerolineales bacterium]|jgi:nicotinamidase/pyrazinamidase
MELPSFFSSEIAGKLHYPHAAQAIKAGLQAPTHPIEEDKARVALMLVDAQVDFVHTDGALSVPGAVDDAQRTAGWIFRNTARITHIFASLDTHLPLQIFFPTWWVDAEGHHPDPYTPISVEQVETEVWRPLYELDWSLEYVSALKEQARKDLMIWPFHVLLGTPGHAITPILYEAIAFHSAARSVQPTLEIKGTIAKTEYYSLLEPEVKVPGDPRGTLNEALMDRLLSFDAIYFAGQAKSHCVLETIASIVKRHGEDRTVMERLYLLEDCTSSVQHPEIDFEAIANETYREYADKGMRIVNSDDDLA